MDVDLLAGRLLLIKPHLDERAWRLLLGGHPGCSRFGRTLDVGELCGRMAVLGPHLFDVVPLSRAAQQAGVPPGTARRRLSAYCEAGSAGLVHATRNVVRRVTGGFRPPMTGT